jgi:hypothetical protein
MGVVCMQGNIGMLAETIGQNNLVATEITGRKDHESSRNRKHFWAPVRRDTVALRSLHNAEH